jgi:single-stranded-DNA-specific exonuclease
MSGIGFNMANKFDLLLNQQPIDLVYTIDENEWNGKKSIQINVIDFKLSA